MKVFTFNFVWGLKKWPKFVKFQGKRAFVKTFIIQQRAGKRGKGCMVTQIYF